MATDLEIAQSSEVRPIAELAEGMGLAKDDYDLFGKYMAKVSLAILANAAPRPAGRYVVVSCMTPTPLGEGKTTTTIGIGMALSRLGHRAAVCLRQPSLGPVFGIKGGAAGGGQAQILPMEDLNLHLTGDTHAVSAAHNLLAAFLDNSLFHDNPSQIDPYSIFWQRTLDLSDRALRSIVIGLGGRDGGVPRESSFGIAAASEVMAVLSLATSLKDLRSRLGRIVVGLSRSGKPITAEDLGCAGAMAVLLKDAVRPNLLQTLEHTPAFIHTGPFGYVTHGNSSILADQMALRLNDYAVTEAGFGSELGMEKLMDIKCRHSGLHPDAVVMVATLRALKMHGSGARVIPGKPFPQELYEPDLKSLEKGCLNLVKHIENAQSFRVPVVVALNHFGNDTDREIALVERFARDAGAEGAFVSDAYARGGGGAISLAEAVVHACKKPSSFQPLYPLDLPVKAKIERIAEKMYGASGVDYTRLAESKIKQYAEMGFDKLPVCMAKTHLSLSHDPALRGQPRRFRVPIQDIRLAAGAGYLIPICGEIRPMPALPSVPIGTRVDLDDNGRIVGLF